MHYDEENQFSINKKHTFVNKSFLSRKFLLDVLLMSAIPLPYVDYYFTFYDSDSDYKPVAYTYLLSDFLLAIMLLRFAFIIRALMKFNIFNRPFAMRIFKSYGHEASPDFTVKALLQMRPERTCIFLFVFTSCVFAYWIRIFEIPFQREVGSPNFNSYHKALWFTVVTVFTIGYGDYYPNT